MADESMIDIQFGTNPKGDIPHYSLLFMNPKPLITELNNEACYRLAIMLYLWTNKCNQAMDTL